MSTPFTSRWLPLESGNAAGVRTDKTDRTAATAESSPGCGLTEPTEVRDPGSDPDSVGNVGAYPSHVSEAEPRICLDCHLPINPNDLLCDPCFQARKVVPLEELARRREERRRRMAARLEGLTCGTCGKARWHVSVRGDAFCLECFWRVKASPQRPSSQPKRPFGVPSKDE